MSWSLLNSMRGMIQRSVASTRTPSRSAGRNHLKNRLAIEALEERCVPSTVVDFDAIDASSSPAGVSGPIVDSYLAGYGITLSHLTPATAVVVMDYHNIYGGVVVVPPSPPNVLTQTGSIDPVSFEVDFAVPQDNFGFTRPHLNAGQTGVTHPQWDAFALDVNGSVLDHVGEPLLGSFSDIQAATYALHGPGITAVRFDSDSHHFAGYGAVLLDDFVLSNATSATHFSVSAPASITAGTPFNITVSALDASGNIDTGYTGTVHFTPSDEGLPADYTFQPGDHGLHTFTDGTLTTAGSRTISVADSSDSTLTGSATTMVNPAAASAFDVTGFPTLTVAGVAAPFTVTARDSFGNIATGYHGTVRFDSTDDHAVLPVNYTFTVADQGTHAFAAALRTAGTQELTVTDTLDATVTGTQPGILVIPAGLDHFSVEAPDTAQAGEPLAITVAARDPYDNVVPGYHGTISFSSTDGQATLPGPYTFTTADLGTHSFSGVILRTAGSRTVSVRDGTNGPTGSATIAVTPAAADHLLFLQQPSDTAAGQTISPALTVEIVDQYGNVETSDNSDTVTLSIGNNPNGGTLTGTLTVTVSGGIATFSDLSIDQIGDGYTLLAAADGLSSAESSPFRIKM